ncbi:MAG: MMPL family transporter [candidate division Zixibacteria bacterium]|nr:MMPL family transporter [candidate division Zixibacteria bacterium]
MTGFFRFFVKRHMLANLFTIMTILLGIGTLIQIKRDIFPEVDFGEVIIVTRYPGASPEDVELNVTNELEEEIKGVSNLDKITSYSMENISVITVSIDLEADDKDEVRQDIREAVNRVTDLPPEVTEAPLITEVNNEIIPVVEVGVSGDIDYRKLRETARLFKKKLENVKGVSKVEEFWYLDREVKIKVDPDSIEKYQIPLQEIAQAVRLRNIRLSGGTFESYSSEKGLLTLSLYDDPEEAYDVIVRSTFNGPSVKVKELARIVDDFEEPRIITRMNGEPAITFQVLKKKNADIIRTVDAVREMAAEEEQYMPDGVTLQFSNDISSYVSNRFNVVLSNGAIGLALVVILLTVFLTIRAAFWVALSIPVVVLGVIFLLPFSGAYLDVIGLTAILLVIGIIVDDGIIVGENIVKRREMGEDPHTAAANGIREVSKPVFATLITTFLAFAPMFFMTGVTGDFVVSIPRVITLALIISLFELVVALPTHLVGGLGKMKLNGEKKKHWFDSIRDTFRRYMRFFLKLRYLYLLFSIVLFAGSIWYAVNHMQFILFPKSAADVFMIYAELPLGSSIQKSSDKMMEIEQFVENLPENEVQSFATRMGTHGERRPGENEHWAFIRVNLSPYAQRNRNAEDIVEELRMKTDQLEGFDRIFYNIEAGGPPVGDPITLRIVGSDDDMRKKLTDSIIAYMQTIEGMKDIDRNDKRGKMQVELMPNYEKLSSLGLTVADIASTVRTAYDGEIATNVRYGEQDVEFRVILEDEARDDTSYLPKLLIPNRSGRLIELGEVTDFRTSPGPGSYYHYNGERTTIVTSDLDKDKAAPLVVTNQILDHFNLDRDWTGMRVVVGGESEETSESFRSLFIAFAIAVIGIYFILILLFDSVTQPLMVMVAIPFGIISVIFAFAFHGEPLGFLALMGLVGLTGVVVNDSLVMVNHINRLRREHPDRSIIDIVSQGAADRLRAITMTTLTTVVGLLPLAYGIGGSDPFIAPMALALGYGLLFATPLTLALVPSLYVIRTDIIRLFNRIIGRAETA